MKLKDRISKNMDDLVKCGVFGKKRQTVYYLSHESWKAAYNITRDEWKKRCKKIRRQYKEIRMHKIWSTRIGEYIPRYLIAAEDSERNAKKGILDVFVMTDCICDNQRLSKIVGRNIHLIDKTNVDEWIYILSHFPRVEFTKYWMDYADRNKERAVLPSNAVRYFKLTEAEKEEAEHKKFLMGLHGPFVCATNRDPLYLSKIQPTVDFTYHNYRDTDIHQLNLSADYLSKEGITMVRMGRFVQNRVDFNNCIDYANDYYDELMDIVLMKDCKFFVGDSNGVCIFPMALNKPLALKNVIPAFLDGWGGHPQNPYNLFIFKKYYNKKKHRFLSIKEMMMIEKNFEYDGKMYEELGIEVVENNAEEILDLVMEMNARIDGKWVETPEDIELQKKYRKLHRAWCRYLHLNKNAVLQANVGAMFLKKNPFLLEG